MISRLENHKALAVFVAAVMIFSQGIPVLQAQGAQGDNDYQQNPTGTYTPTIPFDEPPKNFDHPDHYHEAMPEDVEATDVASQSGKRELILEFIEEKKEEKAQAAGVKKSDAAKAADASKALESSEGYSAIKMIMQSAVRAAVVKMSQMSVSRVEVEPLGDSDSGETAESFVSDIEQSEHVSVKVNVPKASPLTATQGLLVAWAGKGMDGDKLVTGIFTAPAALIPDAINKRMAEALVKLPPTFSGYTSWRDWKKAREGSGWMFKGVHQKEDEEDAVEHPSEEIPDEVLLLHQSEIPAVLVAHLLGLEDSPEEDVENKEDEELSTVTRRLIEMLDPAMLQRLKGGDLTPAEIETLKIMIKEMKERENSEHKDDVKLTPEQRVRLMEMVKKRQKLAARMMRERQEDRLLSKSHQRRQAEDEVKI